MREDFDALRPPRAAVEAYPPDRDALFSLVRPLVPDASLRVIAACDHGSDADAHFAALVRLRDGVGLDEPMGWAPNEVLSLFRWGDLADEKRLDARAFHLARAFCCGALLRTPDVHENRSVFDDDALAPLIESCLWLGEPFRLRLQRQIVWALETMEPWDEEYLFYAFGLLVAAERGDGGEGDLLRVLGEWVVRANREILPWHAERLLGDARTFMDIGYASTSPERWRRLARGLQARLEPRGELAEFVALVAREPPLRQRVETAATAMRMLPILPEVVRQMWRMWRSPKDR